MKFHKRAWFWRQLTCGFLSSGHSNDSNLKAVYKPPNPPPNMQTLGFCNQIILFLWIPWWNFKHNLERRFPRPITHANRSDIQKRNCNYSKTLLSGHAKFVGSFSASDISSRTPPLPPFSPEAKNRNCNRFLRELENTDEPIPLLLRKFGISALHCFAPPETTKRMLMQCNNY